MRSAVRRRGRLLRKANPASLEVSDDLVRQDAGIRLLAHAKRALKLPADAQPEDECDR
jgi:hypothetical protein